MQRTQRQRVGCRLRRLLGGTVLYAIVLACVNAGDLQAQNDFDENHRSLASSAHLERVLSYVDREEMDSLGLRASLNDLVDESCQKTKQQQRNIAFIKTHKTGSTTMASILYRYGARHNLTIAQFSSRGTSCDLISSIKAVNSGSVARPEIMFYHHQWEGKVRNDNWKGIKLKYQQIMSLKLPIRFVTIFRDPVTHYISYFYYFIQPKLQISLEAYLNGHGDVMSDPMCAEFGIWGPAHLRRFMKSGLDDFSMILLTEKFDEGLVVMSRLFGWDLIDLTYAPMLETKDGAQRWDGLPLEQGVKFSELGARAQERLLRSVELDKELYEEASARYEAAKAKYGDALAQDVATYKKLQGVIANLLVKDASLDAVRWYSPETDDIFYKTADPKTGWAPTIPF